MATNLIKKIKQSVLEEKTEDVDIIDSNEIVDKIKLGYELQRSDQFKKRTSFTPSGLTYGAGHCPRYWFLHFEGNDAKNSTDWYSVANMDSGTDRHKRIQTAMRKAGILISDELPLKNENPPISGKTDAIIKWNDSEILTEIKTINNESFGYLRKPRNYHIEQLLIYMKILQKGFAYLIYENKNTHELRFYPIQLNQHYKDFMAYFWDWMTKVKDAFDNNQLPENPHRNKFNSKMCRGCEFLEVCQTKGEGTVKIEVRKELE